MEKPPPPEDLRLLLNRGTQFDYLLETFGREKIEQEIDSMIGDDMADVALRAAIKLQNNDLARRAAEVVLEDEDYSDESRELAARWHEKFSKGST